jgi:hypothetical protein
MRRRPAICLVAVVVVMTAAGAVVRAGAWGQVAGGAGAIVDSADSADSADSFLARHRAAVAANTAGLRFTAKLATAPGERAWFYQGELIPIELVFESLDGGWHGWWSSCGDPLRPDAMEITIDAADWVTWSPGHDLIGSTLFDRFPAGVCGCVMGGTVGGLGPAPLPPPIIDKTTLNERLRFDRPGRYRLFFGRRLGLPGQERPSIQASVNVLEIEIRPADPEWQAETLADVVRTLDAAGSASASASASAGGDDPKAAGET